jgi:hypothetical protein
MELSKYAIMDYITDIDNFDMAFNLVSILNSYDGSMSCIEYFYNDEEFFDIFFGINTMDAVRAVCFGDYRYNDEFVKFDGYGNLESANKCEVLAAFELYKEDIADKLIEVSDECDIYIDYPDEFYLN